MPDRRLAQEGFSIMGTGIFTSSRRNISDILRKTKWQTSLNLICDYSLYVHRAEVRRNRNLNNLVLSADMLGRRTEPQQQKIIIIFKVMLRSTTLTETVKTVLAILILVCIIELEHLFCSKNWIGVPTEWLRWNRLRNSISRSDCFEITGSVIPDLL